MPIRRKSNSISAQKERSRPGRGREIVYRDPKTLVPREKNPRTHSHKQIKQISGSIKEFGFLNPVLIDGEGRIIAGHGRISRLTDLPPSWSQQRALLGLAPRI
jgi:hypothetical protein